MNEDCQDAESNNGSATTSSSTSKLNDSSNNNSLKNASSLNQINLNISSNSSNTNKNITVIPYDTLFLNSCNENDISTIIKNMDKVYDKLDQDSKVTKVCNFKVKAKK